MSEPQIRCLKEQANRLQIPNVAFYTMAEVREVGVKADCVALLDVLEHTVFPDVLLDGAQDACAFGGIVCITVPNSAWAAWNRDPAVAGAHVATESLPGLIARCQARGQILDARLLPGTAAEQNANASVSYVWDRH